MPNEGNASRFVSCVDRPPASTSSSEASGAKLPEEAQVRFPEVSASSGDRWPAALVAPPGAVAPDCRERGQRRFEPRNLRHKRAELIKPGRDVGGDARDRVWL
jgi:hypothetical protein